MADKLFTQFQASVKSFDLRESNQGLIEPAVYRGYDSISGAGSSSGVIPIKFVHGATAFKKVAPNNNLESDNSGVIVFPNGMLYHDSVERILNLPQSPSGTRYHLLVAELEYVESPNASQVNYIIIEDGYDPLDIVNMGGSGGVGTITIPNPAKQVAIGFVKVVPGTTIANVEYERFKSPALANGDILGFRGGNVLALVNKTNTFTEPQNFDRDNRMGGFVTETLKTINNPTIDANGLLVLSGANNSSLIVNCNGSSINLRGFTHTNKPFGSTLGNNLLRGTSIKIRFVNVGAGSTFLSHRVDLPGFTLTGGSVNVAENVLYTLRLDNINTPAGNHEFSVSANIDRATVLSLIDGHYKEADLIINESLINTSDVKLGYSVIKKGTKRLVTLVAETEPSPIPYPYSGVIPPNLRPSSTLNNAISDQPYLRMSISSTGNVTIDHSNSLTGRRVQSISWHLG